MLRKIKNSIYTTLVVNIKSLKLDCMQYFMMVFVYPLSYLVISIVSGGGKQDIYYITGIFTSMFISIYINMQAPLISTKNNMGVSELYAVYNVPRLFVFWGECIFHLLLIFPVFVIETVILCAMGTELHIVRLAVYLLITFPMLSVFAMFLGSLIRNPQVAGALINMLYMIVIMTTPIYNNVAEMSQRVRSLYAINPFSHVCSLFYWGFGMEMLVHPLISVGYCVGLSVILYIFVHRKWKNRGAIEKLNIW